MAERLLGVAPESPMFGDAQLAWKYWAPWRSAAAARSHVLLRDGRIVAHAGALPLTCRVDSRNLVLLHPFDWMSEPSAIGAGAALLSRLSKLADGLLIVGGSELTRRMVRPLGFRALGDVTLYAAHPPEARARAAEHGARELTVSRVAEPTPELCESVGAPAAWLAVRRTPELLRDFMGCPAARMGAYAVQREGTLLGGFVLAVVPGQARVVALWAARDTADLPALLGAARRQGAAEVGVREVVCMANLPLERAALATAGFREAGALPMFLLSSAPELEPGVQFAFQMLDGDLAFLHHGRPQPWL